jgi:HEAT repeat protein
MDARGEVAVRAATAVALGRIGPGAKAAVPALVQALKDDSPQVRQAASVGLKRIQGAPSYLLLVQSVPVAELLSQKSGRVGRGARAWFSSQ